MKVIVSYDVSTVDAKGKARLRRVAKACKSYGVRVQFSVFECAVDAKAWVLLRKALFDSINVEQDSLRFYFLGDDDAKKTEHHGVRPPLDPEGPLIA